MTSGPKVRLGTKWPSITSHWMRVDARLLQSGDLITQSGEVRRQDGGHDLNRCRGHSANLTGRYSVPAKRLLLGSS